MLDRVHHVMYVQRYASPCLLYFVECFGIFPQLVGRFCSYLLPKQALTTPKENITKYGKRGDAQYCIMMCLMCIALDYSMKQRNRGRSSVMTLMAALLYYVTWTAEDRMRISIMPTTSGGNKLLI